VSAAVRWTWLVLPAIAVLAVSAHAARLVHADAAPIQDSPDLPWTNPDHRSSLELLASDIASVIAGRPVSVRCEGDTDWRSLVQRQGGDPAAELGYVAVSFGQRGQVTNIANAAELAGGRVCLPLKKFATAVAKPTKCMTAQLVLVTVYTTTRVAVKKTVVVAGKRRVQTKWITRRVPTKIVKTGPAQPPAPCYPLTGAVQLVPGSFWDEYGDYATAILTLAHESLHLGGIVGVQLANGSIVGDPLAEAKAQCYGMQWMRYVAERLGDTADDGQAIAQYYWDLVYPRYQSSPYSQYWSAECRPGGALDIRPAGATAWP
jgi:hypothetical protein